LVGSWQDCGHAAPRDHVISVVVPAHNEAGWLASSVHRIADGLRARGTPFEIVVVENGSTDRTAEVARSLRSDVVELNVLTLPQADYGQALRTGVLSARGELIAIFDVDFVDLDFLDAAVARLSEGPDRADIVVGAKRGPGAHDRRPLGRRLVTAVFSTMLRLGFGLGVPDTHGIKAMRRDTLQPIADRCRFGTDLFDTELILRAERAGLRVAAIPVTVREERPSRSPIARRALRTVVGLVRLRAALRRSER